MVKDKTVIIVGAGASNEFNLPTGKQLIGTIRSLLKNKSGVKGPVQDDLINYAIGHYSNNVADINKYKERDELTKAAGKIYSALPQAISIDNFIDTHRDNQRIELCGKLAIVRGILQSERNSNLYFDKSRNEKFDFQLVNETWLNTLFKILTENAVFSDLQERFSNLIFIVFNYDRCIEHFLFHAIQNYYDVSEERVLELISVLNIYHPYGKVGSLPWEKENEPIQFGEKPNPVKLYNLTKSLRTFTEKVGENGEESFMTHLKDAKRILFLGFAYHTLNLKLLILDGEHENYKNTSYYGTAYGISDADTEMIISDLRKIGNVRLRNIYLRNDLKCNDLFNEYWRTFSLTKL